MKIDDLMTGLPGEELIRQGLADVQANRYTIAACLIHIARPRLSRAGLLPQSCSKHGPNSRLEPEIQLYRLLKAEAGDAYSRYNALLRELVSFEMALDHRVQKQHIKC